MVTEKQRFLIRCFEAYEMDEDEIVGTMLLLRDEKQQDEMLAWIKENTDAESQEVLEKALEISG